MSRLPVTPSQTVGPYFAMQLFREGQNVLATPSTEGERIRIEGVVYDGDRKPVEDALIELWQADARGRYRHPRDQRAPVASGAPFLGFGRASTDFATGAFWFETIRPGPVPGPAGTLQAPHLSLTVQARGMLRAAFTRLYFGDEGTRHAEDPVLRAVPEARRATLIAAPVRRDDVTLFRFDVHLQGPHETVFFVF